MVEGWLLIVPREHYLSMAGLPSSWGEELKDLKVQVGDWLRSTYGSVCFFEHGAALDQTAAGCGVDHAHLHALPLVGDVVSVSQDYLPPYVSFRAGDLKDCRAAIGSGMSYLYFESDNGTCSVCESHALGSQTFRKGIASLLGMHGQWDWKSCPFYDRVELTLAKFDAEQIARVDRRA